MKKQQVLLRDLDQAITEKENYEIRLIGPSLKRRMKRLVKYNTKYINDALTNSLNLINSNTVYGRTFWGEKQPLPLEEAISKSLYFFGILWPETEHKLTKYIIKNIDSNSVFYDVGANYGFYSGLASYIASNGEVHSFEPNPKSFKYLKKFLREKPHCYLNQVAISDKKGQQNLYIPERHSGGATLEQVVTNSYDNKIKEVAVETTTLNYYVEEAGYKPPTFIKLDIEGAELKALTGGDKVLQKYKPIISMEVWGDERQSISRESVSYIQKLGYKPFRIGNKGNLTEKATINYKNIEGYDNFIFKL